MGASTPVTLNFNPVSVKGLGDLTIAMRNDKETPSGTKIAEAFTRIYTGVSELNKAVSNITATVPTPVIPPAATVKNFTLVAATVTIITPDPPTSEGQFLFYYVKSVGTTGLLFWGVTVKFAGTEFDSTPNTWTVWPFSSRIDPDDSMLKWFAYVPSPLTGQT